MVQTYVENNSAYLESRSLCKCPPTKYGELYI